MMERGLNQIQHANVRKLHLVRSYLREEGGMEGWGCQANHSFVTEVYVTKKWTTLKWPFI